MYTQNQFNSALSSIARTAERFDVLAAFALQQAANRNFDALNLCAAVLVRANGQPTADGARFRAFITAHAPINWKKHSAPVKTSRRNVSTLFTAHIAGKTNAERAENLTTISADNLPKWADWEPAKSAAKPASRVTAKSLTAALTKALEQGISATSLDDIHALLTAANAVAKVAAESAVDVQTLDGLEAALAADKLEKEPQQKAASRAGKKAA